MKKQLLTYCAMALATAAPIVTADDAATAPAATPAATPSYDTATATLTAEEIAVKRYVLKAAAATLDTLSNTYVDANTTPVARTKTVVQACKAALDMPLDGLPAQHQPFVRECNELSKPYLADMEKVLAQAEAGEIDAAAAEKAIVELREKCAEIQHNVEAKYPESAKLLGKEASQRLTQSLLPVLYQQASPRLKAHFAEHPEDAGDQKKIHAATFHIMADLLREMADAL